QSEFSDNGPGELPGPGPRANHRRERIQAQALASVHSVSRAAQKRKYAGGSALEQACDPTDVVVTRSPRRFLSMARILYTKKCRILMLHSRRGCVPDAPRLDRQSNTLSESD